MASKTSRSFSFWRHIPLRAQIIAGFAVPIVIVAGLSWLVSVNMETVTRLSDQSERLAREITVRTELLKAVVNAETGERGFIITGNEEFLEPYQNARKQFINVASEWRELSGADGADPQLARMEELFQRWLNEIAEPAVAARSQTPGRLFSHSFNAYYHLNRMQELLQRETMLERVRLELSEYQASYNRALREAPADTVGETWLPIEVASGQLTALVKDLEPGGPSAAQLQSINRLAAGLERDWREITHEYREAEDVSSALVASGRGKALVDEMREIIRVAILEKKLRYTTVKTEVNNRMQLVERTAVLLPVLGVGLGLAFLLLMQMGVISSIERLRLTARRLERGDLTARVEDTRSDELGTLAGDFNRMAGQLESADRETRILNSLQSMLVSSNSELEAYAATGRAFERLLPSIPGALYLIAPSRDFAERIIEWNNNIEPVPRFHPEDCRALRLGRVYRASHESAELFCMHADEHELSFSVCIPLVTRDEVLGTLFLAAPKGTSASLNDHELALAKTVAERLSLALSNLRLTEKLRRESVRDPLTGLYNRRYLEETLEREIQRVSRAGKPLSVITLDVDHFKRFNDTFGHEAGDRVLEELATQMTSLARPGDVVCRFGGEEFMLILPEAATDIASARAEELRRRIEGLELFYGGHSLGTVTISLGVATFPDHASRKEDLLRLADNALYEAKKRGRNQVAVNGTDPS
ncbi:diguanylate cyclase [Pseudidiomarina sp.]|uniref:sensor domain-containing diguanylate cyclase n=1 Tax=Pseudidiomarina sp. TaxID=2081707 RepID=UPI00299D7D73|nr:diguanylate cyclase [Pseudidiomarina sp.]MDX1706163.1 diguanylate cyclase [Pseudidiomarina sp.]